MSAITINPRTPGSLHLNMPASEYHAISAASASRLKDLARSPAHCREKIIHPPEPTPALAFGTAVHAAVLEPAAFAAGYCVAGPCAAITGKGEKCRNSGVARISGEWYCGVHLRGLAKHLDQEQLAILSADDYAAALGIRDSVIAHPAAAMLLNARTHTELSATWTDEESGAACKLRADAVCADIACVWDLKTTEDASREQFQRSILTYRYHLQAAFYLRGLSSCGLACSDFVFVCVEKSPPYAVGVYRMTDEVVEAGAAEVRRLLKVWVECERSGVWPGYSDRIEDIQLPAWAMRDLPF